MFIHPSQSAGNGLGPGHLSARFVFVQLRIPGTGKEEQRCSTSAFRASNLVSLSLLLTASTIQAASCFISASFMPLVVAAGLPRRRPDGLNGGCGSSGIKLLLVVIPTLSSVFSTSLPTSFHVVIQSITIMWLSVPSVTSLTPLLLRAVARALEFFKTWVA